MGQGTPQPVIPPSSLIPTTQQGIRALIQSTGDCAMSSFVRPLPSSSPSGWKSGRRPGPRTSRPGPIGRFLTKENAAHPGVPAQMTLQSHPRGADLSSLRVRLQPMGGIRPGQPGCSVGGASAPERPVTPTPPPGNSLSPPRRSKPESSLKPVLCTATTAAALAVAIGSARSLLFPPGLID
ncbi:hypothetical protein BO78DRAFT_137467 [Aspergillus sclerotiicarbonarius CBS 121057]|uniref:Uncharacterized protein n=1 Tax=Aspergillus sclerotiicarbonarius (strain CBS 121057 / IBT 28362) TaxID=1448318 RepID=A0A319E6Y7_ASPSB|nr:hypothetical protein BO78DRAFT_137467 [Aspergillus sclerotiicarbonarius CBS 121057]